MDSYGRVLIVDNYDSFTYNLVHQVVEITGISPALVKNDDKDFMEFMQERDLKDLFDLIILSPGPGHPESDIGPVTEFILDYYFRGPTIRGGYPTLFGVCMGYEAIGVRLGVPVSKGVPRHGVRYEIEVDEAADASTLFRDLPSKFKVVRYHSLILDPGAISACDDLIVTSSCFDVPPSFARKLHIASGPRLPETLCPEWLSQLSLTEQFTGRCDSFHANKIEIPMSFRHRSLPVFGVQFHPESILSEYGMAMMKNICRISGLQENPISIPRFLPPVTIGSMSTKLDQIKDLSTLVSWPFNFFSQAIHSKPFASVWLDSPVQSSGRWSFFAGHRLGGLWSVYKQMGPHVTLVEGSDFVSKKNQEFLKEISRKIESEFGESMSALEVPISVPCIFTVMGYESLDSKSDCDQPDAFFVIADRVIALDNETGSVFAVHRTEDVDWIDPLLPTIKAVPENPLNPPKIEAEQSTVEFRVRDSKTCYLEKIRKCQTAIELGEAYELCLTTKIESTDPTVLSLDPLAVYKELRRMNPAHNSCFFQVGDMTLAMASPERFLKVDGRSGIAQVKPIKGTRPRGITETEDFQIKSELAKSEKDLAENLMIVDLVRNDLSTLCHGVTCPVLMNVETYAPYHQLVSTVQSQVPDRKSLVDVIVKLFPAGSMTGAPKIRSMQILQAVENTRRGIGYSGAVGYICPRSGDADLAVTIRSILFERDRVSIGCGGAILALSDPEEEWREVIVKARRSLQVLAAAAGVKGICLEFSDKSEKMFIRGPINRGAHLITTMRFENGKGIWLFARHLERLRHGLTEPVSSHELKDLVVCSIQNAFTCMSDPECLAFEMFCPINEGPFSGIALCEWEHVNFTSAPKAARIRIQIDPMNPRNLECLIQPLLCENPSWVKAVPVLVESADADLRRKSVDWYVPSHEKRENTLLVNDSGNVTETGIANILINKSGKWVTPCEKESCLLAGTLRAMLLNRELVVRGTVDIDELPEGSQIYCYNSVRGFWLVTLV